MRKEKNRRGKFTGIHKIQRIILTEEKEVTTPDGSKHIVKVPTGKTRIIRHGIKGQ